MNTLSQLPRAQSTPDTRLSNEQQSTSTTNSFEEIDLLKHFSEFSEQSDDIPSSADVNAASASASVAQSSSTLACTSSIDALTIRSLLIEDIFIHSERRAVCEETVIQLMSSIAQFGLQQPIIVSDAMVLVAGAHRREACRRLGHATIPAIMVRADEANAQIEIHENLIRKPPTILARGEGWVSWQAFRARQETMRNYFASSSLPPFGFTQMCASLTNLTQRTIQQEIEIAQMSQQVRDLIRHTSLANQKVNLLKLCKQSAETQLAIAHLVSEQDMTFKQACVEVEASILASKEIDTDEQKAQSQKLQLIMKHAAEFDTAKLDETEVYAVNSRKWAGKVADLTAVFVRLLEHLNPDHNVRIEKKARVNKTKLANDKLQTDSTQAHTMQPSLRTKKASDVQRSFSSEAHTVTSETSQHQSATKPENGQY